MLINRFGITSKASEQEVSDYSLYIMSLYRFSKFGSISVVKLIDTRQTIGITSAGIASHVTKPEAYRSVSFEDLPQDVVKQLRRDGTRGELRDLDGAKEVYEQNVPAEAKGSIEGVEAVTNDPTIHWMHKTAYSKGGTNNASNGVYGPEGLNKSIGSKTMSEAEVEEAETFTQEIAENSTPGVTGDFVEVAGDTLETGTLGGAIGGGVAIANRIAQIEGYKSAGRYDLAAQSKQELGNDAAKGAINGVVRGTSVAVTQALLGANPVTAGIGLVAPDAIDLIAKQNQLSEEEYNQKAIGVVGKAALATTLVCAGPIGWVSLVGLSIAKNYGKAQQKGSTYQITSS